MKPTILLLTGLLAGAACPAFAQTTPPVPGLETPPPTPPNSTYEAEHDSLQQRATRIRTRLEKGIASFGTSHAGLQGTSRRTRSFGPRRVLGPAVTGESRINKVLLKRQIVKHKTHNAQVEKLFYYGNGKRVLLYEYYEDGQLVHQKLREYAARNGREYAAPFRITEWTRGDYLEVTIRPRPQQMHSSQLHYYFTAPRPHTAN